MYVCLIEFKCTLCLKVSLEAIKKTPDLSGTGVMEHLKWMLDMKPGSSVRVINAFHSCVISPAMLVNLCQLDTNCRVTWEEEAHLRNCLHPLSR